MAVLADGHLDFHFGKTAMGILRYRTDEVVALIDGSNAGKTTGEVVGLGGSTPIVSTLDAAMHHRPDTLLIGVATRGGMLPPEWRRVVLQAIRAGLTVVSGLHQFLADDPELATAAADAGTDLVDVRKPPTLTEVATGQSHRSASTVITFVGSDCAVGKMSVALDIEREAKDRGTDAVFLATGQTGMMIAGNGVPLDRVVGDFMAGAIEQEVLRASEKHDIVLVEGQGSLLHPAYSGVTLALIHGSQPDAMILTVMPARDYIEDYTVDIPSALELIEMHEAAAGWIHPAAVIGVAVNTLGLSETAARATVASIGAETALPATDTFRFGAGPLVEAVVDFHRGRIDHQSMSDS